jgi:DNA-binding XRE family transcriptional regulator
MVGRSLRLRRLAVNVAAQTAWFRRLLRARVPSVPRSPDPDQALAAVLKRMREERKITQETLAYNAGLSVGTLGRIEVARTAPSWDSVCRIIDALDVSLSELAAAIEAER